MSRLNWTKFNGAEFESLVHAILFFTVKDVVLFGRPGADRGQDAITGDHSHVYQAKYGKTLSMVDAIGRTKKELDKIQEYRKPGNANYEFWKNVKKWTLVANFETNPDDERRWNDEIVTACATLGLEIDYWDATKLDNLLSDLKDVEAAYFGGFNRCFLSMWEEGEVLKSGVNGKYYFTASMAGRKDQISEVEKFSQDQEKRFMFVRGPEASGKTRFLYEVASLLAEKGWRVFWGLTESMSASDLWMQGISNTCEKTFIIVDDPRDANLLQRVYEQLSVHELHTWRAIISCRDDRQHGLASRFDDRQDTVCIDLPMLKTADIGKVVDEYVSKYGIMVPDLVAEALFRLTNGAPGVVSLILGDCAERGVRLSLSETVLKFAQGYVKRCLETIDEASRMKALAVLRWVSAWRTIVTDDGNQSENAIVSFLASEIGDAASCVNSLLLKLVDAGLIVQWGRNRKIYTAEPTLMRQQVLSDWLLARGESHYQETAAGRQFVKRLLNENIPEKEKLIANLAQLSGSYMGDEAGQSFLSPIFSELHKEAQDGDVIAQFAVFEWLKKVAAVDPESSLDILKVILDCPKEPKIIKHRFWGDQMVSSSNIMAGVGMFLLELSNMPLPYPAVSKLWNMIKRMYDLEIEGKFEPNVGEKISELLPRMLSSLQSVDSLQEKAYAELCEDCKRGSFTEFNRLIAEALLMSRRESVVSCNRQIVLSHRFIRPGMHSWERANGVRKLLFSLLLDESVSDGIGRIWKVLSTVHYGWRSSEMLDSKASAILSKDYDPIVLEDLKRTLEILQRRSKRITKAELSAARSLWVTALKYAKSNEERDLAISCENEYKKHFKWPFQEFFSWDADTEWLSKQINSLRDGFATAAEAESISAFFDDGHEFLYAQDSEHPFADCGRGHDVALQCRELYGGNGDNAYGAFLQESWIKNPGDNAFKKGFAQCALMIHLQTFRLSHNGSEVVVEMRRLLDQSEWRGELVVECYQGLTQKILGRLSTEEFAYLASKDAQLTDAQLLAIIPCFLPTCLDAVMRVAEAAFERHKDDQETLDRLWWRFLVNYYLVVLRSRGQCDCPNPIKWFMGTFISNNINASVLGTHELGFLVEDGNFKFSQKDFVRFLKRRIAVEKNGKPYDRFEVMPFQFEVGKWVSGECDSESIKELCQIAVTERTFVAAYRLPEYLAELNPEGTEVAAFVEERLASGEEFKEDSVGLYSLGCLASQFPNDIDDAWIRIVKPICKYMLDHGFSSKVRRNMYCGFQRKMKSWSCGVGEVPPMFVNRVDEAKKALRECLGGEELQDYRKWALEVAEWELKSEQERAEEDRHE